MLVAMVVVGPTDAIRCCNRRWWMSGKAMFAGYNMELALVGRGGITANPTKGKASQGIGRWA